MSTHIPSVLRQLVEERANHTCEYCLLNQRFSMYKHEIDHIIAVKHGGKTIADNLVLACLPCNRYKGSDLTSIDPLTVSLVELFNGWLCSIRNQGSNIAPPSLKTIALFCMIPGFFSGVVYKSLREANRKKS